MKAADFFAKMGTDSEIAAAFQAGNLSAEPMIFEIEGVPMLTLPEGLDVHEYQSLLPAPKRLVASERFADTESFAEYVNRYKNPSTLVKAVALSGHASCGTITACIDYHGRCDTGEGAPSPSWRDHEAHLILAPSPEWQAWMRLTDPNNPPTQWQLAEHLEDWIHTVAQPDGAMLRDMVNQFHAMKETTFRSAINVTSGTVKLTFIEDTERGIENQAQFPSELTLVMPIFEGGQPETIKARLRYRVGSGGKLTFQVVIVQKELLLRKAFLEVCEAVKNLTGLEVLQAR